MTDGHVTSLMDALMTKQLSNTTESNLEAVGNCIKYLLKVL